MILESGVLSHLESKLLKLNVSSIFQKCNTIVNPSSNYFNLSNHKFIITHGMFNLSILKKLSQKNLILSRYPYELTNLNYSYVPYKFSDFKDNLIPSNIPEYKFLNYHNVNTLGMIKDEGDRIYINTPISIVTNPNTPDLIYLSKLFNYE